MSDKPEIECDELSSRMFECLDKNDHEQCKEFIEEFNNCCKTEETQENEEQNKEHNEEQNEENTEDE